MNEISKTEIIKENFWMSNNTVKLNSKDREKPDKSLICPADNKHHIKLKKLYKADICEKGKELLCYACNDILHF